MMLQKTFNKYTEGRCSQILSVIVLSVMAYLSPIILNFYGERYWSTQENRLFVALMDVKRFANRKVDLKLIQEFICHHC